MASARQLFPALRAICRRSPRTRRLPRRRRRPAACPRRTPRAGSPTAAVGRGTARPAPPPRPRRRRCRTDRDVLAAMRADVAGHVLDHAEHRHAGLAEQVDRAGRRRSATGPAGSRRSPRRPAATCWISDSWTSPVPGGRSTISSSASPQSASISLASAPVAIGPRQASAWPGETSCPSDRNLRPCASTGIRLVVLGGRLRVAAEQGRLRGAVDVGIDEPDLLAQSAPARWRDWPRRSICRPRPCRCRSRSACGCGWAAVIATRASLDARALRAPRRAARARARRAPSSSARSRPRSIVATPPTSLRDRIRLVVRQGQSADRPGGPSPAHRKRATRLPLFFAAAPPYRWGHEHLFRAGRARPRPVRRQQGTVGTERRRRRRTAASDDGRPSGPWGEPPRRGAPAELAGIGDVASLDEFLRRSRDALRRRWRRLARPARRLADHVGGRSRLVVAVAGVHDASIRSRPGSAASSPASAATADAGPGRQLHPAVADRPGEEDRRREYPQHRPRLGQADET